MPPPEKKVLTLSPAFKYTLDTLEKTKASAFITGRAGTGKSTLLKLFVRTTKKRVAVVAPTGIAALNVGGQTIHSFFKFPPKLMMPSDIRKLRSRRLYKNLDLIIIDEISMVRADMLDNIDRFLRINREQPGKPFGGVQMVFFGDLFQLPPVVVAEEEKRYLEEKYDSPYFFSSDVVQQEMELDYIELHKVYRQEQRHFLRLLEAVRTNRADRDDLEDLNERYLPDFEAEDYYITLTTINRIADNTNNRRLRDLDTREYSYLGKVTGKFDARTYPAPLELRLRVGAQVMFVRNDPEKAYVNGTIGKVVILKDDEIQVAIRRPDGTDLLVDVQPTEWEIKKYKPGTGLNKEKIETEVIGSYKQYPLRLAWAITIHRSQGKTFERVILDMGRGAFEHGQTYVALSRCTTLEGLVLKQPIRPRDILLDDTVVEFYEQHF